MIVPWNVNPHFSPWYETDPDCAQYMRHSCSLFEMIQAVWLDTTEDDIANGCHEYCIVRMQIDIEDYYNEEQEIYVNAYGYTLNGLWEEYGYDALDIIAECILETEILNDAYVIDEADTFFEAKEKIKKIIKEDD